MSQVFYATVKQWVDVQTSLGGVVTFYPTADQTATGTALFSVIYAAQFTAEADVTTAMQMPLVALKAISASRQVVTANVGSGVSLAIPGATLVTAPDGTKVHCLILGN